VSNFESNCEYIRCLYSQKLLIFNCGERVAFLIGLLLTSIMMSIVASAVNTVIVCFAEAPEEFQLNHPRLSDELRAAWQDMYPSEFI